MGATNGVAKSHRRRPEAQNVVAERPKLREETGRVPPHDLDAEAVVIAESLESPDSFALVAEKLKAEEFYSQGHRWIWRAICDLTASGIFVDHVAVAGWLRDRERLAQVGGAAYLVSLVQDVPVGGILDKAARVTAFARARKLIATAQQIAAEGYGVRGDYVQQFLDESERSVVEIAQGANPQAGVVPTVEEPMRGLKRLAEVAVVGRDRILGLASQPVAFIWTGIVIAGIVVVIAGGPGSGKTTLLFLLLAARLNLGPAVKVLGREVTPAPVGQYVVLIEAEHGDASAARKLTRSFRLLGIDDTALDRVILIARRSVVIGSPEWAEVGLLVQAGLVSDIAVDTLARVAPADANDEREQVAVFEQIARTIELAPLDAAKPVAWVVAHTRKTDSDELTEVSGSAQRTGQADTVLMVRAIRSEGKVTSSRVTFAKLREEPDEYPAPIEYTVTADTTVDVDAPRAVDERPLEERILERLALGPQTKGALRKALRRNLDDVEAALTVLFQARRIATTEISVRGKKCPAFEQRGVDAGSAR